MKLANATLHFSVSTDELSRGFALEYSLSEGECYALRNDLRKMRLAQTAILLKMRMKFPVNCTTEERRQEYLNYFEDESWKIASVTLTATTTSTSDQESDQQRDDRSTEERHIDATCLN